MNFDFSKVLGETSPKKDDPIVTQEVPVASSPEPRTTARRVTKEVQPQKEEVKSKVTPINKDIKNSSFSNVDENKEVVRLAKEMENIKDSLNNRFIEREDEINMLAVAFVSGTNAFLHGKPGTGKSDLVEEFSNRFTGNSYFRMLMSKTTEPSEVFGPVSINSLKQDKYRVNTDNKLPSANIAFLDEIFKSNSAILNGLLTIMNEKLFFNDVVQEVPMVSIIGASNEFPEESGLAALYDRFLLRWNVEGIKDVNNREKLFKNFVNSRNKASIVNSNNSVASNNNMATMNFNDLELMIELAKKVSIDDTVLTEYNKLFTKLEKEGIEVSDRRKNEAIKTIQANAVLNGRLDASISDFEPLVYCFWEETDDIPIVKTIIDKLSNPDKDFLDSYTRDLGELRDSLDNFIEENKDTNDFNITKAVKLTEMRSNVNYALDKISEKIETTANASTKKSLEALKDNFKDFLDNKIISMFVNE